MLNGLSQLNVELTSRCDKHCKFCGHQNPKINQGLVYGDIDFGLLQKIAAEVPAGIVVQFHRDGEPLLYPRLREALGLFAHCVRSIVTNGQKLGARLDDLIENCETVCVSVFDPDPERAAQVRGVEDYLARCATPLRPRLMLKYVGDVRDTTRTVFETPHTLTTHRRLHIPQQSRRYKGGNPLIPEHGICADFLHHPSIDWQGNVYLCNRLDPTGQGKLGNIADDTLAAIWARRHDFGWFRAHVEGRRDDVAACRGCQFWGVPNG